MAIKFGMTVADMIMQLTKGFMKATGRKPEALEKIKIQQEAVQRFKDQRKVVDMEGNILDPSKPIMGGTQEGIMSQRGMFDNIFNKMQRQMGKGKPKVVKTKNRPDVYDLDDYDTTNMSDIKKEIIRTETKLGNLNPESEGFREKANVLINKIEELKGKMRDDKAMGGRIGYKLGSIDKARRAFLKTAAGVGGGIAALKTGLLGLSKKAPEAIETVKETVSGAVDKVPPYFFRLVEKIRFMGEETLASQDKAIAKKYKDYVMEEDFAGNITIVKKGEDLQGNKLEDVYMSYKVDDVSMPDKKGFKKVEEYEEFTARPDMEGKMKDVEPGVPNEVIEEAGDTTAMTLKKADGGRIGYSKGKIALKAGEKIKTIGSRTLAFLEKVFGKEAMAEMPKRDPDLYKGLLEVAEAYRARDKEGLKMYMQKYLPHMNDAELEEFIVGNPEIGDMSGVLLRLGSGRDYKAKLDMINEANKNRKLADLEVTEEMKRKPNASGGIAKLLGE